MRFLKQVAGSPFPPDTFVFASLHSAAATCFLFLLTRLNHVGLFSLETLDTDQPRISCDGDWVAQTETIESVFRYVAMG